MNLTEDNLPKEVAGKKTFGVQWSGFLTPNESGDFLLGVRCEGFGRVTVDGKQVAMAFGGGRERLSSVVGRVHLEKGRKVALEFTYGAQRRQAACRVDLGQGRTALPRRKRSPLPRMPMSSSRWSESQASLRAKRCP